MIIGFIRIDPETRTINTHRDSFLPDTLTVVSVRRPFLAGGFLFGLGFIGFAAAFGDLLYPGEIAVTVACALLALAAGWQTGQLKLLSRDLRGTELSDVIWGRYADLNRKRAEIVGAIGANKRAAS